MERWACADVPSLALQFLLDDHPDWQQFPVAVVDKETAQGIILEVNRRARAFEIKPGIRYAAGLSLSQDLRAGVVEPDRVEELCGRIVDELHQFSPDVEPDREQPGLFWLRATGLDRLFGGFDQWASSLYEHLRDELGFRLSITVGWTRFGTFATSRISSVGWRIFESAEDETAQSRKVPLDVLGLPAKVVRKLDNLGVRTVGEFCELPSSGVRKRYGEEAATLWRFAHGGGELPLQAVAWETPVTAKHEFDDPMWDATRLTFVLKSMLRPLLLELAGRHCDLRELDIVMKLEDGDEREMSIRPASPTLEDVRIIELIRLKLDRLSLPAGIVRADMEALGTPYHRDQSHLFRDNARRDLRVANHALARLQAEHGEEVVSRIVLEDRHLPEGQFRLEPFEALRRPAPSPAASPTLVRRLFGRPQPLPRFDPDIGFGWLVRDLDEGVVMKSQGPYRISGGWWMEGLRTASHIVERRLHDSSDHHASPRARYLAREGIYQEPDPEPPPPLPGEDGADDAMRSVAPHRGELYPAIATTRNTRNVPNAGQRPALPNEGNYRTRGARTARPQSGERDVMHGARAARPQSGERDVMHGARAARPQSGERDVMHGARAARPQSGDVPGVARDYWYVETDRGDIFWVFWDHRRRQWFLHGVVE